MECQIVWIQIRTVLVLIWVQTVLKGYQQRIKVMASKERDHVHVTAGQDDFCEVPFYTEFIVPGVNLITGGS